MTPKAIFFDLGNTLVSYYHKDEFLPVLRHSIQACLLLLESKAIKADFEDMLDRAIAQDAGRADHRVTPIEQRLAAIFPAEANRYMPELVAAFMEPPFATARILPGAIELLQSLNNKGLPMLLMSNTPWGSPSSLWRQHLEDIGLAPWFQELVFCMDVGWRKPDARIFHHALDIMGLHASEVLFVGDDPEWDVAGARGVGMPILLLDSNDKHKAADAPVIRQLSEVLDYC